MQMYIMIGKVLAQHETVVRVRHDILLQKKQVESAASLRRAYGRFEDCGDGYIEDHRFAERLLENLISRKISEERILKRVKCELREAYPQFDLSAFLVEAHKDNKRRVIA